MSKTPPPDDSPDWLVYEVRRPTGKTSPSSLSSPAAPPAPGPGVGGVGGQAPVIQFASSYACTANSCTLAPYWNSYGPVEIGTSPSGSGAENAANIAANAAARLVDADGGTGGIGCGNLPTGVADIRGFGFTNLGLGHTVKLNARRNGSVPAGTSLVVMVIIPTGQRYQTGAIDISTTYTTTYTTYSYPVSAMSTSVNEPGMENSIRIQLIVQPSMTNHLFISQIYLEG